MFIAGWRVCSRQPSGTRPGAGRAPVEGGSEASRFERIWCTWKWQAQYWRSQHGRAKERIAAWQAKWKATKQELADALQKILQLRRQVQALQQENEGLRQENKQLLQSPFKKRSDKSQGKTGSDGGQQSEPEAGRCQCPDCGRPYRRNGEEVSERIEVEVKGHVRRIRRSRYRAACACAQRQGQAVPEEIAPLEPALFRGSGYGLSVWVALLIQVYWQRRPVRAFEREWADCGVRLPAGTLLGHVADFLTWFEPLEAAIEARQKQALCVHGDETSWVVHVWAEAGENPRGWLWVCLSEDAVRFRVDRSRSAEAARKLFGQMGQECEMVLVCDRYAAYVRLAREHPGQFVLAICWVHVRRDYVKVGRCARLTGQDQEVEVLCGKGSN